MSNYLHVGLFKDVLLFYKQNYQILFDQTCRPYGTVWNNAIDLSLASNTR
jgi:hypothetical protein